ncbi:MAG: DUF126 domain-containing protein [Candidatus Hodarchaeales archaeon]|jgi:predicted aconitase with swiveling domain
MTKLEGREIFPPEGRITGEALVTTQGISFYGGVDPENGKVTEVGHELEGQSVTGKILVFPTGKGSTVGSYTLYRMKKQGTAPLAMINKECETITAVGAIISEIPCIDKIEIEKIENGSTVAIEGTTVEIKE